MIGACLVRRISTGTFGPGSNGDGRRELDQPKAKAEKDSSRTRKVTILAIY